jgi:hypothetical protein
MFNLLILNIVVYTGSFDIYSSFGNRVLLLICVLNLYIYYL